MGHGGIALVERATGISRSTISRGIRELKTTATPGEWAAEQLIEALDFDDAPHILIRDRDKKFGDDFNDRVDGHGIQQILSAHRCPWQNGCVERVIGTVRRECLDHVIIVSARHLRQVLDEYIAYYNESRTHLGIEKDCPQPEDR